MLMQHETYPAPLLDLVAEAEQASKAIPPLFPLASSVAVNPFIGQSNEPLALCSARYARVAGTKLTPDRQIWKEKLESNLLKLDDVKDAVENLDSRFEKPSLENLMISLEQPHEIPHALPTIADLSAEISLIDWPDIIEDRIGHWASSHFDEGQALWQPNKTDGAYLKWRNFATRDLTPEIHGLTGFGTFVDSTSRSHWRALGRASQTLSLAPETATNYFHRLLMTLGGWAQYGRYLVWQSELNDQSNDTTTELLAIRIVWEEALFNLYRDKIEVRWSEVAPAYTKPLNPTKDHIIDSIFQEASERAEQRILATKLSKAKQRKSEERSMLQAVFCIDTRSETYRYSLESLDTRIETLGFAGFFGLATAHQSAGSDIIEQRGPVLIKSSISSTAPESSASDLDRRYTARAKRAWRRFKLAAVSSFAFVEATGPVYAAKLVHDGLGLNKNKQNFDPVPQIDPKIDIASRIEIAKAILRGMSLTSNFGKIVMVVGHGAHVTNNPYQSNLQCGACGGHAGDVSARLLVGLLNNDNIRLGLSNAGIDIPHDTVFVAALHNTTTDYVTIFDDNYSKRIKKTELNQIHNWIKKAGQLTRVIRAKKLPRAEVETDVIKRAVDWSELRPEWGLAGCRAFIAAPRSRTDGIKLNGQCFLHSYDYSVDKNFTVLEQILTAPVVVASWINLQYYGSTVAPRIFGGGNKLLHNVSGGIGVLEGNGGNLRSGLPIQSIHDGSRNYHDPLRLSVIIEAPYQAITDILQQHPAVRTLFDNGWLHLLTINDDGHLAWRYTRELQWTEFTNLPDEKTNQKQELS
ncbi:MAG: DUF2309 domain-containing protein [Aestuariivita sp.]|nr:DUF2309 domain-containing protein [Aestuariivita sp.]